MLGTFSDDCLVYITSLMRAGEPNKVNQDRDEADGKNEEWVPVAKTS